MTVLNSEKGTVKITVLKLKRIEKGFTQEKLSEKVKLQTRTYQRYESGERLPDVLMGCSIAKELGLNEITELENLFNLSHRQLFAVVDEENNPSAE